MRRKGGGNALRRFRMVGGLSARCLERPRGLSSAEGVSNRNAVAHCAPGTEFLVVVHQIEMRLGSHEELSERICLQADAEVSHEVVDRHEVLAGIEITNLERLIKARRLGTDAGQQFEISAVGNFRHEDRVEIVKHGTIRLHILPYAPTGFPCEFALYSDVLEKQYIGAEAGIGAAGERLRRVIATRRAGGRRGQRVHAEGEINLLGGGEI